MLRHYCKIGDRELGPFSPDQLKEMASAGDLAPNDLVRRENDDEWIPASRLKNLPFDDADCRTHVQTSDATCKNMNLNERKLSNDSAPPSVFEVKAPELEAGEIRRQLLAAWKAASLRFLKLLLDEASKIGRATLDQTLRLVTYSKSLWHRRSLWKESQHTKLALGKKVYQLGVGDEQLRRQIDVLNDRVESLKVMRSSIKPLEIERRGLHVRLAKTVMGDDEPTQVKPEYSAAVNAQGVLQGHDKGLAAARSQLLPTDGINRVRIGVGYAFVFAFLLIGSLFVAKKDKPPTVTGVDDHRLSLALGLVVSGAEVIQPDGTLVDVIFGSGSCFVVSPDGYLLTNKHVVEEEIKLRRNELLLEQMRKKGYNVKPKIWVFFGKDHKYLAEVTRASDDHDLCILKIDAKGLPVFRLSSAVDLSRSTKVFACGFAGAGQTPLSAEELGETIRRRVDESRVENMFKIRDFGYAITSGTVNRITSEQTGRTWVQHNADINPGNSGGPLITEDGTVVGINTLGVKKASGTFFAIMSSQVRAEVDKYIPGVQWK